MKKLVLLVVVVGLVGCQKKDETKPAEQTKPAEPPPKPVEKPAEPAVKPDAPCVIDVRVDDGKVTYEGGGLKAETTVNALDKAAFKDVAGKCSADITAQFDVPYKDVIHTMDMLVAGGITDVGIGGAHAPKKDAPLVKPHAPTIKSEWTMGKDGKFMLTGHFTDADKQALLKSAPVIVMSKTSVTVVGKPAGKPDDAGLEMAIAAALPKNPTSTFIIVQADESLEFKAISAAIDASKSSGYDNVLFAVKNHY